MKLRSIAGLAVATLAITVSCTCFAITRADLNVGGIYIGQNYNDVVASYGQPAESDLLPGGHGEYYHIYKKDGKEVFTIIEKNIVTNIEINDNAYATKAGIAVGATADDVKKAYGTPTKEAVINSSKFIISYRTPTINQMYDYLRFDIVDGKVKAIFAGIEVDIPLP